MTAAVDTTSSTATDQYPRRDTELASTPTTHTLPASSPSPRGETARVALSIAIAMAFFGAGFVTAMCVVAWFPVTALLPRPEHPSTPAVSVVTPPGPQHLTALPGLVSTAPHL